MANTRAMLLGILVLTVTVFSTNGYPYSSEYQTPEIEYPIPEQRGIYQSPEQEPLDDYFAAGGTKLTERQSGFTISCAGESKICTSKTDCINGYIRSSESSRYSAPTEDQRCRVNDQVCCTIAAGSQEANIKLEGDESSTKYSRVSSTKGGSGPKSLGSASQNTFAIATPVQLGCAAALVCVEEKFCSLDGTISTEPVAFSEKELLRRVPLSSCKNPDNGVIGKCCRDPNYVDPWPTGNLPANYSGGFDEQGFPTFLNIKKVAAPKKVEPSLVPSNTRTSTQYLTPPQEGKVVQPAESRLACGVRNKVTQGSQPDESKTSFAEIPWQAMVLHSKERKILCSGALVSPTDVLTAANCVDSLSPHDISIKLGEWKLGYELKHEEPLPFEIINVSSVSIHPEYKQSLGGHDLAMVRLESPASLDQHINPLCLPKPTKLPNSNCIATGWGKSILQAHYAGAIMHAVDMDVLSTQDCKQQLAYANIEENIADGSICAATKAEKNNVCETDVGGPLACQNENDHYELAGIYSQDSGCLATNQVAIFAPLDEKWLHETMSKVAPQESKISNNVDDYRKSSLLANNQYLPAN